MRRHRGPSRSTSIAAVLLLLLSPHTLRAQGNGYVKTHYTKFEHQIPMRDGGRLFTAVYVPRDTAQTYPLLLLRTQSGVRPYGADQYPNDLGPSPLFGKAGYIFVYQDIRGRWMSEGSFVNMRPHDPAKKTPQDVDESSDAYDTIDWLLKKVPNHNGKVGLYGTSYRGFLVAAGLIDAHTAVKAAVPGAPIMDWFVGDDWHHNGALFLAHAFFYMPLQGKLRPAPTMKPPALFDFGTPDAYDFYLRMGPLANADARHFKGEVPFWNEVLRHGTYDDYWKARDLRPHLRNIKPAVMTVGGWFDAENLFGALEAYRRIEATSPGANSVLVMGPWLHGGWNGGQADGSSLGHVSFHSKTADFYREQLELPFFEFHLKGKGEFNPPEARVFETGTNRWREYASWPPRDTKLLALHFHPAGRLAPQPPGDAVGHTPFDEYLSDPAKPVPYTDKIGIRMLPEYMVADQRFAARRPDVLVYETEPLDRDITLAGPILADLHVSTSGTDADWVVKLVDVYPNDTPDPSPNPAGVRMGGYQQLVRGEVMRGKFRDSLEKPEPFTPGKPTAVRLQLPDVCHTFRSGHRIMVQVQSSWFPLVDRNPQSYVDIATAKESDSRTATQRLRRSRELPSRLVMQVLP
ncbi:MAG: putative hydrolase, CocE/NonD family [Gemmataceae bacterium]|nr:putative hydrolase, CocE/NonD family [Gemmataceae bacterium]